MSSIYETIRINNVVRAGELASYGDRPDGVRLVTYGHCSLASCQMLLPTSMLPELSTDCLPLVLQIRPVRHSGTATFAITIATGMISWMVP